MLLESIKNIFTQNNWINYFLLFLLNVVFVLLMAFEQDITIFYYLLILIASFLFVLFFKYPQYIVPILLIMIPLEISKSFIPILRIISGPGGSYISILDFSRLSIVLAIIVWLFKDIPNGKFIIYKEKITSWLFLYLFFCLFSVLFITSNLNRALIELFRYLTYFFILALCVRFLEKKKDIELVFKALLGLGVILSLIGICEHIFSFHLCNPRLGIRSNATFMDPNLFARFLSMVLITALILKSKKRQMGILFNVSIIIVTVALILCVSRGGMFSFILTLIFVFMFLDKDTKVKFIPFIFVIFFVTVFIFVNLVASRDKNLTIFDIGQRVGLIITGIKMYSDNLLVGVGLGSFETVALGSYVKFLPYSGRAVTLSHTSLITIMAEMGSLGLFLVIMIFYTIWKKFLNLIKSKNEWTRTFGLLAISQITIVFLASQSAGRLFEDPFLWLFVGVLISVKKINEGEVFPNGKI